MRFVARQGRSHVPAAACGAGAITHGGGTRRPREVHVVIVRSVVVSRTIDVPDEGVSALSQDLPELVAPMRSGDGLDI